MRTKNITVKYSSHLSGGKKLISGSKILLATPGLNKEAMYRMVYKMLQKDGFTKHLFADWLFSISLEDEKYLEEKIKKEMEISLKAKEIDRD